MSSEQDQHIQKMQQIKDDAIHKIEVDNAIHGANDKVYHGIITNLKSKLYKEEIKNKHYEMVFSEFAERLDMLEQQCHSCLFQIC
jgi:hypothetical protein